MNLQVILEASEDSGYTATVPVLKGCISEGDTKEEALNNIREAILLYLETNNDSYNLSKGEELFTIQI